jgi:hypothetical protein
MLIFMVVTLVSIFGPRFGGGLHIAFALLAIGFFQASSNAATFLIILPPLAGKCYWISFYIYLNTKGFDSFWDPNE